MRRRAKVRADPRKQAESGERHRGQESYYPPIGRYRALNIGAHRGMGAQAVGFAADEGLSRHAPYKHRNLYGSRLEPLVAMATLAFLVGILGVPPGESSLCMV